MVGRDVPRLWNTKAHPLEVPTALCSSLSAMRAVGALLATGATLLGVAAPLTVGAQVGPITYTCVDSKGNKRSSDRPIPECSDREQRVLNKDGSLRRVIPPAPSPSRPGASGQR